MSDDASKFDPRFDPAFQRGYDGPSPESAPRRQPRRSRADSPPEPIGLPPQYSAVEQPRLPERTSDFLQAETLGRRSLDREAHGEPDVDDAPRDRNPFVPVLLACGVGLIGAGAVLLAYFQSLVSSPSQNSMPQSFYYYAQVISYGAPVLICLGLATLIGVLFVHAVRWKPSA